jgi:FlaA1/EpsC-like NDP-sugar epimerase
MTRFVMGLGDAVRLILHAAELAAGGELFVLKMPALRIADLAQVMIRCLAPRFGFSPEQIEVSEIGSKPGEKLFEELLTEAEIPHSCEDDTLIAYLGEELEADTFLQRPYLHTMRPVNALYRSDRIEPLSAGQIEAFLAGLGLLGQSMPLGAGW